MRELEFSCYYCGNRVFPLEREHRVPLARNGADDESNLVPACKACNRLKGVMTDVEFFRHLEILNLLGFHPGPRQWCPQCRTPRTKSVSLPACSCETSLDSGDDDQPS